MEERLTEALFICQALTMLKVGEFTLDFRTQYHTDHDVYYVNYNNGKGFNKTCISLMVGHIHPGNHISTDIMGLDGDSEPEVLTGNIKTVADIEFDVILDFIAQISKTPSISSDFSAVD